jgi:hypothetical protein
VVLLLPHLQLVVQQLAVMQPPQLELYAAGRQQQWAVVLLLLLPSCPCGCVGAWLEAL